MNEVYFDIINSLRNGTVPFEGTEHIAVGIENELNEIVNQLNVVKNGKSAFKFVIGDYGSGKTFFSTSVREIAFNKNYVVSSVVVSQEAPLHKFEELYKKIMDGLRTKDNKKIPAFSILLEEWLLDLEDKTTEIDGLDFETDKEEFQKSVTKRINDELSTVGIIALSFANAIRSFYIAKYNGDANLAQAAIAWLKGDSIRPELKKALGVSGSINRENAFDFFKALLYMIKAGGYEGLVIIIDEVETVQKLVRKDARDAAYDNLRFFIDESDRNGFPGCYFLYTGTHELMESEKGFKSLEPIYQRIKVENDSKHRNLRQPVIYIDGFNYDKLKQVAYKVRDIHSRVYNWDAKIKVTKQFILNFVEDMVKGFDGEIKIGPRGFLRTFIDILDKAQIYENYLPDKEFSFTDEVVSKAKRTEKETAHIINF